MTSEEIAQQILDALKGGKLVGAVGVQGIIPGLTLTFENAAEERASLTITPFLKSQTDEKGISVTPGQLYAWGKYRK